MSKLSNWLVFESLQGQGRWTKSSDAMYQTVINIDYRSSDIPPLPNNVSSNRYIGRLHIPWIDSRIVSKCGYCKLSHKCGKNINQSLNHCYSLVWWTNWQEITPEVIWAIPETNRSSGHRLSGHLWHLIKVHNWNGLYRVDNQKVWTQFAVVVWRQNHLLQRSKWSQYKSHTSGLKS